MIDVLQFDTIIAILVAFVLSHKRNTDIVAKHVAGSTNAKTFALFPVEA